MDNIQFALHRNMEYNGTYPDLTHMVFLLELIVANPPLFDQNHPSFGDAEFKFKIWNEICAAWYKKGMIFVAQFLSFGIRNRLTAYTHILCLFRSKLLRQFLFSMPFCRAIVASNFRVSLHDFRFYSF